MADGMTAPARKLRNPWGQEYPVDQIATTAVAEHDATVALVGRAVSLQAAMKAFRDHSFAEVHAFLDELRVKYRASKKAGSSGGVSLHSFDECFKVEVSSANTISFGPELKIAKELIEKAIVKWSKDSAPQMTALVNDAFRTGTDGKVRVDLILGLKRHKFDDETWRRAMKALDDATRTSGSRTYIRFYQRPNADAKWEQIGLDLSRL